MDKFEDIGSKKFFLILFLICSVFFLVIVKAFEYLPESTSNSKLNIKNESINSKQEVLESSDNTNSQAPDEYIQKKSLNISLPFKNEAKEFEDIEEPSAGVKEGVKEGVIEGVIEGVDEMIAQNPEKVSVTSVSTLPVEDLTPEEKVQKIFLQVEDLKTEKEYVKALEELQKVASLTDEVRMVAKSYEEIATLYAILKRYGTALSYAQKAYNMSPSTSRETLLARLYYKTGEIDKATRRINNVLQRDFLSEK